MESPLIILEFIYSLRKIIASEELALDHIESKLDYMWNKCVNPSRAMDQEMMNLSNLNMN